MKICDIEIYDMDYEAAEDQTEVFAFLADPATYSMADTADSVVRIDTHGAAVFLAGTEVYKVKRAVRFPFMDFSTLEKRRLACAHEIEVNRQNAPNLYLGIVPIRRDAFGFHLGGGQGAIVEWAVHMRRFDESKTFDKLADRGALDIGLVEALAETIVQAHIKAPIDTRDDATQMLRRRLEDTLAGLAAADDLFPLGAVADVTQSCRALFDQVEPLLIKRAHAGAVRRCHGDLHLRNIILDAGKPILFDAIEFDDSIATCDILYDLAFVLMDLWQRGLQLHANRLFNLYLWRIADSESALDGLAALPLFLAQRAAIRARVTAALTKLASERREECMGEARHLLATVQDFVNPRPARLVAIGGLSGSGKSTLAKTLAPLIGRAPGAVHLSSDIERKRLFKIDFNERLPNEAYDTDITMKVYLRLRDLAAHAICAGHSVIVDAVHAKSEERAALAALAARFHVAFRGFWLDAPEQALVERVEARRNDVSDAGAAIVQTQLAWKLGDISWQKLDAARPLNQLTQAAMKAIA